MYCGVNGKGIIEKGQESKPQNIPRASPGTTLICFGTPPKWERMENFKPQKYFDHPLHFTSRVFSSLANSFLDLKYRHAGCVVGSCSES